MTGSGKTNYVLNEIKNVVYGNQHWITCVLPHAKAAIDLASELYAQFGDSILDRLVIEQLSDTDRVIPRQFIQSSQHEDYWTRRGENDAFVDAFMSILAARRKKVDFFETPSLEEISGLVLRLYQNQKTWWPESLLAKALNPKSDIFRFAVENCTDEQIKQKFIDKVNVPPSVAETSTKPVARMLELLLSNAAMEARTGQPQTWDKKAFHNNRGIFLIVGNGCSVDALRTYTFCEFHQTVKWMKDGVIGPGVFVVDEVANYGLAGSFEATAFNTMRGSGLSIWHIVQAARYSTEEVTEAILENSDHMVFRQGGSKMAKFFAEDLLPVLDEYHVHHTTTRQVHDGFDVQERYGSSITKREDGGRTDSETYGTQLVPKYVTQTDNAYQSGTEQLIWFAQKLQDPTVMPRGSYFYKTANGAGKAQAHLFRDSWAFHGLKEAKYLECLQKIKATAIYSVPTRTPFQPPTASPAPTRMRKSGKDSS